MPCLPCALVSADWFLNPEARLRFGLGPGAGPPARAADRWTGEAGRVSPPEEVNTLMKFKCHGGEGRK